MEKSAKNGRFALTKLLMVLPLRFNAWAIARFDQIPAFVNP
jgi:hypothetical protein